MPSISVIIITKNEAHDIQDCLESVKWADEIVVVDSGSSDATRDICQKYTNKVFLAEDWCGYGVQKNRALEYANSDWILSLDADERVTPELHQAIISAISSQEFAAYSIPFQTIYCGLPIRHHTKHHVRLFRRNYGKFNEAKVHENLLINGKIGKLKFPILHHTYQNLEEMLLKMNHYSTQSAQEYFLQGKTGNVFSAFTHGLWAFIQCYFLQRGFLDGKAGLMLAVSKAEYSYYRYLKLMFIPKVE